MFILINTGGSVIPSHKPAPYDCISMTTDREVKDFFRGKDPDNYRVYSVKTMKINCSITVEEK